MISASRCLALLTLLIGGVANPWTVPTCDAQTPQRRPGTLNLQISPQWSDAEHFTFRRQSAEGPTETVRVDAATGKLEVVETSAQPKTTGLTGDPIPRSGSASVDTEIEFVNRTEQIVELRWIDSSGERRGYEKLSPGQSYRQHTFAGHAWEVVDDAGKYYGGIVADTQTLSVEIKQTFPRPKKQRGPGARRNQSASTGSDRYEVRIHEGKLQQRTKSPESGEWKTLDVDPESLGESDSLVSPQLSPDGRVAVAWVKTPGDRGEVFIIESSPKGGGRAKLQQRVYPLPGDAMDQFRLVAFETETDKPLSIELPVIDFGYPRIRWRRGHEMLIEKVDRGHQRFRLFAIDPLQKTVRTPIDESSDTFIWTTHGPSVPLVKYLDNDSEVIYSSEREGWRHLYLVNLDADLSDDPGADAMQPITKGEWLVRGIDHINPTERTLDLVVGGFHSGQDPYHQHYVRVDFNGENLTALTRSDGDHTAQFSPDRTYVLVTHSRVDSPPVHELRRASDGELIVELARAERVGPADELPRLPSVFSAKGRDGKTDIWGLISFPPDYDPAADKTYPVIESIYAGPHDSHVPKRYSGSALNADLTSLGFIVVRIDGMGTANRSKAFHDVCWHNLKDAGFPDRIAWMRAAAEEYPAMDLSRVGIYGTSAGGQNACGALLFHGEFYKAAMASCGCHDNRMDKSSWNEQWMGYPVGDHYGESSNIDNAANLNGDLLLIVGELDTNVPPESTVRLVDALIKADKTFDFLMIPGLGHSDGGNYGRQRTRDFFVEKLQPELPATSGASVSAAENLFQQIKDLGKSSPWDAITHRYTVDRDLLMRRLPIDIAPQRIGQLDHFLTTWQKTIESHAESELGETDQKLRRALLGQIETDRKAWTVDRDRSEQLLARGEFVSQLIDLCEHGRRGRAIDHAVVATQLAAILLTIPISDKDQTASESDEAVTRSAKKLAREFDSWRQFYADYDPMFDWRVADTADQLSTKLKAWANQVGSDPKTKPDSDLVDTPKSPPQHGDTINLFSVSYPELDVYLQRPNAIMPAVLQFYRDQARKNSVGSDEKLADQTKLLTSWNELLNAPEVTEQMFPQWSRSDQIDFFLLRAEVEYQTELLDWRKSHTPQIAKSNDGSGIEGSVVGRERLMFELKREFIADTPEKLIELAEREYEQCRQAMIATAKEMGFGEDWQAAVEKIKTLHVRPGEQPELIRETADASLAWLRRHGEITIDRLAEMSWRMEMMSPKRQLVNPFFTGGEVISVSFPTRQMSVDAQRQSLRGNNQPFARATVHHELIPGHHWQFFQNDRYQTHRRGFSTPFWLEGWAVYWEFILERNGFVQTPEERMGFLVWRAHRYARILFSLRFHLGQLSPDQCVDFLVENVGFDRLGAEAEVRRSVGPSYPPLYQAGYMLGAMQLQQLAGQWEQNASGDMRAFHDAVTQEGNLPIALLDATLSGKKLSANEPPQWQFEQD